MRRSDGHSHMVRRGANGDDRFWEQIRSDSDRFFIFFKILLDGDQEAGFEGLRFELFGCDWLPNTRN